MLKLYLSVLNFVRCGTRTVVTQVCVLKKNKKATCGIKFGIVFFPWVSAKSGKKLFCVCTTQNNICYLLLESVLSGRNSNMDLLHFSATCSQKRWRSSATMRWHAHRQCSCAELVGSCRAQIKPFSRLQLWISPSPINPNKPLCTANMCTWLYLLLLGH